MAYILQHQGMYDPLQKTRHQALDAAIDGAIAWFFDGYEDIMTADLRRTLEADAIAIREKLLKGEEFFCQRFQERISIHETVD